jgi:hypothetical protein
VVVLEDFADLIEVGSGNWTRFLQKNATPMKFPPTGKA